MSSRAVILLLLLAAPMAAQDVFDTPDPFDEDFVTGVAVGQKIPDFRIPDSNGKPWDFDAIKGPRGAVLLFYRSADW